jgi:hypothetical protein
MELAFAIYCTWHLPHPSRMPSCHVLLRCHAEYDWHLNGRHTWFMAQATFNAFQNLNQGFRTPNMCRTGACHRTALRPAHPYRGATYGAHGRTGQVHGPGEWPITPSPHCFTSCASLFSILAAEARDASEHSARVMLSTMLLSTVIYGVCVFQCH